MSDLYLGGVLDSHNLTLPDPRAGQTPTPSFFSSADFEPRSGQLWAEVWPTLGQLQEQFRSGSWLETPMGPKRSPKDPSLAHK